MVMTMEIKIMQDINESKSEKGGKIIVKGLLHE